MGAQRPPWDPTRSLLFKLLSLDRCFLASFCQIPSLSIYLCVLLLLFAMLNFALGATRILWCCINGRFLYLCSLVPVLSGFSHPLGPASFNSGLSTPLAARSLSASCLVDSCHWHHQPVRNQEIPQCLSITVLPFSYFPFAPTSFSSSSPTFA